MPPDPNQKMEELLKACAKQRREQAGAPFELHPATRRLLQGEVRRLLPPAPEKGKGGSSFFSFRRLLMPGVGVATATICAVFLVKMLGLFTPPKPSMHEATTLTFNQKMPEEKSLLEAARNPALGDDLEAESRRREIAKQDKYLESLGLNKDKLAIDDALERKEVLEKAKTLTLQGRGDSRRGIEINSDIAKLSTDASAPGSASSTVSINGTTNGITIAGGTLVTGTPATPAPQSQLLVETGAAVSALPATPQDRDGSYGMNLNGVVVAQNTPVAGTLALKPQVAAPEAVPATTRTIAKTDQLVAGNKTGATGERDEQKKIAADIAGKTVTPAILNTFEIQLDGDRIRLIDADGSVYIGKINIPKMQQVQAPSNSRGQVFSNVASADKKALFADTAPAPAQQPPSGVAAGISNTAAPVVAPAKVAQQQQQNFSFHASGTNLRLKKVVVVEGVYISEQPPGGQVGQSVAGAAKLAGAMKQTAQSARATVGESTDVKIQGQAQVGNEEKIDINAIAVPMKAKN